MNLWQNKQEIASSAYGKAQYIFFLLKSSFSHFRYNHGLLGVSALVFETCLMIFPLLLLFIFLLQQLHVATLTETPFFDQMLVSVFPNEFSEEIVKQFTTFIHKFNYNTLNLYTFIALITTIYLSISTAHYLLSKMFNLRINTTFSENITTYMLLTLVFPIFLSIGVFYLTQNKYTGILVWFSSLFIIYFLASRRLIPFILLIIGSLFATLNIQFINHLFGIILQYNNTYKNIYGFLWLLPAFMMWLFFVWSIILYTASLMFILSCGHRVKYQEQIKISTLLFEVLYEKKELNFYELCKITKTCPFVLRSLLEIYEQKNWIVLKKNKILLTSIYEPNKENLEDAVKEYYLNIIT